MIHTTHKGTVSTVFVNSLLLLLVIIWTIPTLGIFVTSFRYKDNVFNTGWWHSLSDKTGYTLENYEQVLAGLGLQRFFVNGLMAGSVKE